MPPFLAYFASVNEKANAVKSKSFLLPLSVLTLLVFAAGSTHSQTVITFDDIPLNNGTGEFLAGNYHGLVWNNFGVVNGILAPRNAPFHITNGVYYGVVSSSNVAVAASGGFSEIDSPGTNFNFLSAYFTPAWNNNLNIEVQGFSGINLIYDQTVIASATNSTLFTFNYSGINRLSFTGSGGQSAFDGIVDSGFAMDNFTFEFVPEPSPASAHRRRSPLALAPPQTQARIESALIFLGDHRYPRGDQRSEFNDGAPYPWGEYPIPRLPPAEYLSAVTTKKYLPGDS